METSATSSTQTHRCKVKNSGSAPEGTISGAAQNISAPLPVPQSLKKTETRIKGNAAPSPFIPFIKTHNAQHQLTLSVKGMHCARCIWAIESALEKAPGIIQARVNMSTNRLFISWRGEPELADHYVALVEALGYGLTPFAEQRASQDEDKFLLRCMAIAGFAMGNIMLISVVLWSSNYEIMGLATRDLLHWVSALIALPAIIYAGRPFFNSAYQVLKRGHTNMDVPISLALLLASAMSLFETLHSGEHTYFDSAVMLLFFLLIGRWLDSRARGKARKNAEQLLNMMQGTATVLENGTKRLIAIADLKEGMEILIAAGEKVPTDAIILHGASEIDTSLVTGETLPRFTKAGDTIYSGTMNLSSPLTCKILRASEDSLLADIIRLMEQAEQGRARYVRLADKAAKLYTPIVHTLALAAFLGWFFIGGASWQSALLIAITTLIITCPCALGLAVPVVQVLATSWLMKHGILVKSGDALERLARIDTIIFDKTGTLTKGTPTLVGEYPQALLQLAASLCVHSHHPYSQAISHAYTGELLSLKQVEEIAGTGLQANHEGHIIRLGKTTDTHTNKAETNSKITDKTPHIYLTKDDAVLAIFHFTDPLRSDAKQVIHSLHNHHINTQLLSGDRPEITENIAKTLSIAHWHGGLMPAEKTKIMQALQQQGANILMVGDGLNDAPSLAMADISISPASAVDIAQNSADIVFQGEKLAPVLQSWRMARFSTKLVQQNFIMAAAYNCLAIPLAVAGYVTPLIAAIAMSLSSLIVIANSFRIQLVQAQEE